MPQRPFLHRPPPAPPAELPKAERPSWLDLLAGTVGGLLGLPVTNPDHFTTPKGREQLDRAVSLGELLGMGAAAPLATLGMITKAAKRGPSLSDLGRGIKAYHGSPHDFDRFSLERIGTGEGAQVYGHGLYFAENEATARAYRDRLAARGAGISPEDLAYQLLQGTGGDREAALREVRRRVEAWRKRPGGAPEFGERMAEVARILDSGQHVGGRMYEVRIDATPEELLDWESPLREQSPLIREAISAAYGPRALEKMRYRSGRSHPYDIEGGQLYRMAGRGDYRQTSEALRQQGVKGVQYLDQGSRAAGEGTRNFVIFDDQLIAIARKYGVPLAVARSYVESQGGTVETRR